LTGYSGFGQADSRSFSKFSFGCGTWRLKSRSVATTHSSSEPSASLSLSLLLVVVMTYWGCHFCSFLLSLGPFLAPLPLALDGAPPPAGAEDHFPIALNKDGLDCFFTKSVVGGDIKQLIGGL
jgi:hypothetical protein